MSRNAKHSSPRAPRKPDRRVDHTREALGDALVKLMHEKQFEDITVKHILTRAGVSRSTFYTHFSDKNDLFLSDAEEFFEMMAFYLSRQREASRRVAPVREMFSHIAEWRPFYNAMVEAGKIQDVFEIGQECFARAIDQRLAELSAGPIAPRKPGRVAKSSARRPASPNAQMLAGALMSLMNWWLHSGQAFTPAQMDDRFHDLVWAGIKNRPPR